MELKILIPFLLSVFAFMETQQLITKTRPSGRRRSWRQQTSVRVSLPRSPAALPLSNPTGPSITNEISLGNLNLAPGQSKIIRQTMVIRRPGTPLGKGTGGHRGGSRLHSAISLPSTPQGSISGNGQRGANNHGQHSSGLFLLSRLPPSVAPSLQPSAGGHKTASLTLPVIDLSHHVGPASGGTGHGAATGGNHNSQPHHASSGHAVPYLNNHNDILGGSNHGNGHGSANNGHGNFNGNGNNHPTSSSGHGNSNHGGPVVVSANDLLNTGIAPIDIARHLLAGNPDIVIVPQGSLEQSPAGVSNFGNIVSSANAQNNHDFNNLNNANNLPGHPINLAGQTRISPKPSISPFVSVNEAVRLNPVHTTTEPGEDPPELPETI